jgi:hypothetical protein
MSAILDKGRSFDRVIELTRKGLSLGPNPEYEIFGNYLLADAYTNMGMKDRATGYYAKAKNIGRLQAAWKTGGLANQQRKK